MDVENLIGGGVSLGEAKFCSLVTAVVAVKIAVALPTGGDALARAAGELGVTEAGTQIAWTRHWT